MITRITGVLESIEGTTATISLAGGIAYEVLIPAYIAQRLRQGAPSAPTEPPPAVNPGRVPAASIAPAPLLTLNIPITLHTLEYLEGQGQGTSFIPRLIGFASPAEREFFDLLTTVKGLGNKRTLRALAAEPGAVVQAIIGRDARRLQDLPEIGKKLAETIILELREKAQKFASTFGVQPDAGFSGGNGASGFIEERFSAQAAEAISALTTLGEQQHIAEQMVSRALRQHPKLTSADEIISAAYAARVP